MSFNLERESHTDMVTNDRDERRNAKFEDGYLAFAA
jgi:hypothetical protein